MAIGILLLILILLGKYIKVMQTDYGKNIWGCLRTVWCPKVKVWGCIQMFPHWVHNEIYANKNKH
jgi:hypothetical protein